MGQTQFMPDTYLDFAVDEDGDGRRDIWGSTADALGSTGDYLPRKAAWRRGQSWAREVVLPEGFDYGLSEGPSTRQQLWATLGVRTADRVDWTADDVGSPAQLILPAGWTGPAFLVLPNHMAIRAYNNSTSYALAVGLLADRIAGAPGLVRSWPPRPAADSRRPHGGPERTRRAGLRSRRDRRGARAPAPAPRPGPGRRRGDGPPTATCPGRLIQALKQEAGLGVMGPATPLGS